MKKYFLNKKAQRLLSEAQQKEDALNQYCIFQREEFNEMEKLEIQQLRNQANELLKMCDTMSTFSISFPTLSQASLNQGFSPSGLDL